MWLSALSGGLGNDSLKILHVHFNTTDTVTHHVILSILPHMLLFPTISGLSMKFFH
jgi:hypothetical protein